MKITDKQFGYMLLFMGISLLTLWAWRAEGTAQNVAKWTMIAVMAIATLEETMVVIAGSKKRLSKADRKLFRVFHTGGAIMSAALLGFIITGSLWFDLGIVAGLILAIWATLKKVKFLADKAKKKSETK
jgi:hypothetical protein